MQIFPEELGRLTSNRNFNSKERKNYIAEILYIFISLQYISLLNFLSRISY